MILFFLKGLQILLQFFFNYYFLDHENEGLGNQPTKLWVFVWISSILP
jgi:hypothetical protein